MFRVLAVAVMALCVGTVSRIAHGQVVEVWSAGDGEKIRPETETMPKTETKPGGAIELFGMRNETLSFQVVVKAGAVAARDVKLQIEGLDVGEVSVFRVDAVQVAKRSHGLVWKPGSAAEPTVAVGAIPDRLVPLSSNETVTIPARGQQVFWVDLWVSPRAKPGLHTARLTLMSEVACEGRCSLDVSVELLDRTMPDEMRARSMVWFSGTDVDERVLGRYFSDPTSVDSAKAQELRLRHYQLARKHRISLFGQHQAIDTELDDLLSGEAFTEARGYRGPGQGRGLDVLALHAYGGELTQDDASRLVVEAKKYPDLIDSFVYIMDEPGSEQRSEINRRVKASRPMTSFVTTMYTPKLDTDIFALLAGMYSRKNAEAGAAAGKKIWIYNGERPFTGSFAIDDVAISPRVNPWIQYKLGIERWFYWEATYYFDFQGKRGAIDVASDGLNFTNRHGDRVNGDGLLMYPGRDLLFPTNDAGIAGPIPSIRLKNWRRGIEDVEYLVMARAAGFGKQVDALLEAMVPRVVDQVKATEAVSFPEDGAAWRTARRYLFELLRDGRSELHLSPIVSEPRSETSSARRFVIPAVFGFAAALLLALWLRRSRR